MDVNWLDNEEQQAWRSFLRGHALIIEAVNHDMTEDNDLTLHEYEVLVRLSEAPGRQERMSNLANDLVHSRSRLTHTVNRLEREGFVERFQCSDDRRGINCLLTDKGYEKLTQSAPNHVDSVRRHLVDLLERDEFIEFGRICAKLVNESPVTD